MNPNPEKKGFGFLVNASPILISPHDPDATPASPIKKIRKTARDRKNVGATDRILRIRRRKRRLISADFRRRRERKSLYSTLNFTFQIRGSIFKIFIFLPALRAVIGPVWSDDQGKGFAVRTLLIGFHVVIPVVFLQSNLISRKATLNRVIAARPF